MTTLLSQPVVPEIQWDSLDGIPAIWSSSPGPFAAGIVFRAGRADEPLAHAGITHLAEHLALNRFGPETYHVNGSVDGAFTTFSATGDEETASDFMQHLIRNASRFDAARLGTEVKIVEGEARQERSLNETRLLWARFGARGFGLLNAPEYATRVVDPMDVAAWAEHRFVRNNAAFWFTGMPPSWLEASLPEGAWQPPPPLEATPVAGRPGVFGSGHGTVAVSMLMRNTAAADLAVRVLRRRAVAVLRDERALCRDVECWTLRVGADASHVTIAGSCGDQNAGLVGEVLLDLIDEVAAQGAAQAAIDVGTTSMAAQLADPERRADLVQAQARRLLLGGEPRSSEQVLAEWRALEPASIAAAMGFGSRSMLMLLPESATWRDARLPFVQASGSDRVGGRAFHPRQGGRQAGGAIELTIGPEGISLGVGQSGVSTVRFDDCAGLVHVESGGRVVIGRNGTTLLVEPAEWKDGTLAVESLDTMVPMGLRVPLAVRH